jgi:hypothetical protein
MPLYQFTIFRQVGNDQWHRLNRQHTNYNIEAAEQFTEHDFAYYATMLVAAERACSFDHIHFSHVVAYEVREGKPFDAETFTHTMICRNLVFNDVARGHAGLRTGVRLDEYFGLQYRRNRVRGMSATDYLPGCVGGDDVAVGRVRLADKRPVVLNMEGTLATKCFPLLRSTIEQLGGSDHNFLVDDYGSAKLNEAPYVSRHLVSHVTNNQRQRIKQYKRDITSKYIENLMGVSTAHMIQALWVYRDMMDRYQHFWGDMEIPNLNALFYPLLSAASCWHGLAHCLGYEMPENPIDSGWNYIDYEWGLVRPAAGSAVWRRNRAEIDSCVKLLFAAQQYLSHKRFFFNPYTPRGDGKKCYDNVCYSDHAEWARTIYEDWPNLNNAVFRVMDAINVLNKILILQNGYLPAMQNGVGRVEYWPRATTIQDSAPAALVYDYYEEIYPLSADPFLTRPKQKNIAVIKTPEEVLTTEIISDWKQPREPDEYESWFDAVIKDARRKLKQVARMINNLRSLVPFSLGGEPDNEPKKPNE